MKELIIDPIFRDKIPPLTAEEFKQLEQNIVSDGEVREPIVVWNNTIVDGHNRYKIVQLHPEIPFKTKKIDFESKWDAIDWMISNQLGRRNVTDEQRTYLLGKLYEARKNCVGAPVGNSNAKKNNVDQRSKLKDLDRNIVRQQVAMEQGVGEKVIRNASTYAQGLDRADTIVSGFKDDVLKGVVKASKQDISSIRNMDEEQTKKAVEEIKSNGKIYREAKTAREQCDAIEFPKETVVEMTVEMFRQELSANIENALTNIKNGLVRRSSFLSEEAGRAVAIEEMDRFIEEAKKIRGLIE